MTISDAPQVPELPPVTVIAGEYRAEVAQEFRKEYERGNSIRSLAEASGRSYGFVHRLLGESGVQLRGRGGSFPRHQRG